MVKADGIIKIVIFSVNIDTTLTSMCSTFMSQTVKNLGVANNIFEIFLIS